MPRPDPAPRQLDRDLADLKLLEIAKCYREVLDEAARTGSSMLEVFGSLIGMEQTIRQQRALERAHPAGPLPGARTLTEYVFHLSCNAFPRRPSFGSSTATSSHGMAAPVLIGPTGTGKTHLLTAPEAARGRGARLPRCSYTRVVDMLNQLTAPPPRSSLVGWPTPSRPTFARKSLLLDELGYHCRSTSRGRPVVPGSRCPLRIRIDRLDHESHLPGMGHAL